MKSVQEAVQNILDKLKNTLTESSFISARRDYQQLLKMADKMEIMVPSQKLFDAFAADDHGSKSRRIKHAMVIKRVDLEMGIHAIKTDFRPYNPIPLPSLEETETFLANVSFPLKDVVDIRFLIVRASDDLHSMHHKAKGIDDDYMDSMKSIHCFFAQSGDTDFDLLRLNSFLELSKKLNESGAICKNRWYCNQKAVAILKEVALTGHYKWNHLGHAQVVNISSDFEPIRQQYLRKLKNSNMSYERARSLDTAFHYVICYSGVESPESLKVLSAKDVQRITNRLSKTHDIGSLCSVYCRVRLVLHYLYEEGITNKDCSSCLITPAHVRKNVAGYFTREDEISMREHLDDLSLRDKAICLLAIELGLRDYDISHLRFDQIDWNSEHICIIQHKTDEPLVLPLLTNVGNALMDYILQERPKTGNMIPYVFLTSVAPFRRLQHAYLACRKLIDISGAVPVQGRHKGSHIFRENLVHRMLENQVKHQVITDVLGHKSKQSDKAYITMEPEMLRQCAIGLDLIGSCHWEEGEQYA